MACFKMIFICKHALMFEEQLYCIVQHKLLGKPYRQITMVAVNKSSALVNPKCIPV